MQRWRPADNCWVDDVENLIKSELRAVGRGQYLLLAVLALLVGIWSINSTIALRHLLFVAVFVLAARQLSRDKLQAWGQEQAPLLLLTGWFVLHAAFITVEPVWAFNELSGQWLKAVFVGFLGAMTVVTLGQSRHKAGERLIMLWLWLVLLYTVLVAWSVFALYREQGRLILGVFPFTMSRQGKLEVSYMLSIGLAIMAAEIIQRLLRRPGLLPWKNLTVALLTGWLLAALLMAGARNALIGVVFLMGSGMLMWLVGSGLGWRAWRYLLPVGLLVGLFVALAIKSDPRWAVFLETVPLAWDTENHTAWLTKSNYPLLSNGMPVDDSAYERIAWIKKGLELFVTQYWFGYGYGRNVFAHAVLPAYGVAVGGHSHSGYVDLALSGGVPALLLWLAFAGLSLRRAIRHYLEQHSYAALLLFFIVMGFNGRMLLDSVWRDHYLQIHLFLVCALTVIIRFEKQDKVAA